MDAHPPLERTATLAVWMGREHANIVGSVHGGIVMKLCDEAAGLAAVRYARRPMVTAAVDRLTFLVPVFVGELLTLSATVNAVWRTSMEVGVHVDAENPLTGARRHTNTAFFTIVAVDEDGSPVQVPSLVVEDGDERGKRREREAQIRRANRLAERERIREQSGD